MVAQIKYIDIAILAFFPEKKNGGSKGKDDNGNSNYLLRLSKKVFARLFPSNFHLLQSNPKPFITNYNL